MDQCLSFSTYISHGATLPNMACQLVKKLAVEMGIIYLMQKVSRFSLKKLGFDTLASVVKWFAITMAAIRAISLTAPFIFVAASFGMFGALDFLRNVIS